MKDERTDDTVQDVAEGISSMRIRGAGKIARAASEAIAEHTRGWKGTDKEELISELKRVANTLISTRPTAVSLRNSILLTLGGAEKLESVDEIKAEVSKRSKDFVVSAELARDRISDIGSKRIPKGSTVMTHCNSMAALTTIEKAFKEGRVEMVYSTESRPWRQGHITAKWLLDRDIPVTMIVDSAARHFMRDIDAVLVGADTIASNGAVINKIGTSQIALFAHESRVLFLVCAETFKFSKETLFGSLVEIEDRGPSEIADPKDPKEFRGAVFKNPVFDVTPPEYVDAIITELGMVSPYLATEVIREMFGLEGPVGIGPRKDRFKWIEI
ncbi:MAG: ribose 1,5-bisphosphate isomerase [Thermoplasmatota archaeon]